jgi:hypothetical protein
LLSGRYSVVVPVRILDRPSKPLASTAVSPLMTASANLAFAGLDLLLHLQRRLGRGRDPVQDAVDLEATAEGLEVDRCTAAW